jgi:hypothetical protein
MSGRIDPVERDQSKTKKGETWRVISRAVQEAGSAAGREKCIRQIVRTARRTAKFLSNPAETDRYTARTVIRNGRTLADKNVDLPVSRVIAQDAGRSKIET